MVLPKKKWRRKSDYLGNVSKDLRARCVGIKVALHQILSFLCFWVSLCNALWFAPFRKQAVVPANPISLAIAWLQAVRQLVYHALRPITRVFFSYLS